MSEIVTVCADVYVPAAGEKVGVAACAWPPVPLSAIVWVVLLAFRLLSVSVTVPVKVPVCVGAKATAIRHWPPDDTFEVELQSVPPEAVCVKLPIIARFDIMSCWLPALVIVTVWAALVVSALVVGKTSPAARLRFTSNTSPLPPVK